MFHALGKMAPPSLSERMKAGKKSAEWRSDDDDDDDDDCLMPERHKVLRNMAFAKLVGR